MDWQTLTTTAIVAASSGYALWSLAPAALRAPLLARLRPGRPLAPPTSGCGGCTGCGGPKTVKAGHSAPAANAVPAAAATGAAAAQPMIFVRRRPGA